MMELYHDNCTTDVHIFLFLLNLKASILKRVRKESPVQVGVRELHVGPEFSSRFASTSHPNFSALLSLLSFMCQVRIY